MMPYDSYRLYQLKRAKSAAEIRRADEQAGRLAYAVASLFGRGRARERETCHQLPSYTVRASPVDRPPVRCPAVITARRAR